MKIYFKLFYLFVFIFSLSCKTDPILKINGVYSVDKDSLEAMIIKEVDTNNELASNLLKIAIQNAVLEFQIKGDSVNGFLFIAGESTLINSKIISKNDSLLIKVGNSDICLLPSQNGLSYINISQGKILFLKKSENLELSKETKLAIEKQIQKNVEEKQFEENLGVWKEEYYVDEFGDKTDESYIYTILRGEQEDSRTENSTIYIKAFIQKTSVYFEIYNKSMSSVERLPDSKYGTLKIKYEDESVKSERIFFYKNTASESAEGKNNLVFNHIKNENSELKLLIDLSTVGSYYSDKYVFSIKKNNLSDLLQ